MVCNKLIHQAKPHFQKKCERAAVWAASCERTFGGIGKAKAASEGTTKNVYVQEKCVFIAIGHIFLVSLLLFIFVAIEMAYFC